MIDRLPALIAEAEIERALAEGDPAEHRVRVLFKTGHAVLHLAPLVQYAVWVRSREAQKAPFANPPLPPDPD